MVQSIGAASLRLQRTCRAEWSGDVTKKGARYDKAQMLIVNLTRTEKRTHASCGQGSGLPYSRW